MFAWDNALRICNYIESALLKAMRKKLWLFAQKNFTSKGFIHDIKFVRSCTPTHLMSLCEYCYVFFLYYGAHSDIKMQEWKLRRYFTGIGNFSHSDRREWADKCVTHSDRMAIFNTNGTSVREKNKICNYICIFYWISFFTWGRNWKEFQEKPTSLN